MPTQKSTNEPAKMAAVESAAPAAPIAVPSVKPSRRPTQAIRNEAGIVASIVPVT